MIKTCIIMMNLAMAPVVQAAEPDTSLVGIWVQQNYRTVIGTGPMDTRLEISGHPGAYLVSYTFGHIARAGVIEGRILFKTTTTTYSRLPLKKKDARYVFTLPEENRTIHLQRQQIDQQDALVIVDQNQTALQDSQRAFIRRIVP